MTLRARFLSSASAASIVLTACGGDSGEIRKAAVRDSAGIRIVEHPERAWIDAPTWSVDPEPVLALGVAEGAPEYQFSRVTGALRLDDGVIVVADGASAEIRFFDGEGTHLRSVGRHGAGPGEYRFPRLLTRHGPDSLLVWDGALNRGTVLASDGTFSRMFGGPDAATGNTYLLDTFGDGSLLGRYDQGHRPDQERPGVIRHTGAYYRFHPSGELDTIGRFFSGEGFISGTTSYGGLPPFARRAVAIGAKDRLHYGSSDSYEIRTYTVAGELVRVLRGARTVPVRQKDIDALEAKFTDPAARRALAEAKYPANLPAYAALEMDPEGNLWVGDYLPAGAEEQSWTIFDAEGGLRGRIVTPARFTVHEIGKDYLLGSSRDELDVERILLYRLARPGPG